MAHFRIHCSLTVMTGTLHDDQCKFTILSPLNIFRMRNISDNAVDKIKRHILCLVTSPLPPPQKFLAVYEVIFETYCRVGRATDDNAGHEHCVPDT